MKEKDRATLRVAKAIYERSLDAEGVSPEISDRLERTAGQVLMDLFGVEPKPKEADPHDLARQLMEGVDYDPDNARKEDRGVEVTRKRMLSLVQFDLVEKLDELRKALEGESNADATMALYEKKVKEKPTIDTKNEIERVIQRILVRQFQNQDEFRTRRR